MTIKGSCLCGGITFEFDQAAGPFEICHCSRCRKVTGSIGMPAIAIKKSAFRYLTGQALIKTYAAPLLHSPPSYTCTFCSQCGSPVPMPTDEFDEIEIPAGLLDDDPGIKPDKHIFIEYLPAWDGVHDDLPTLTREEVYRLRTGKTPG